MPFRRTSDILNVRSVAICQGDFFQEVLHVAVWTFDIETGFGHKMLGLGVLHDSENGRGPCLVYHRALYLFG